MDLARFYNVFGSNYDGKPHVLSYYFAGTIDEASMHNAELSAAQVASLYASGSAYQGALPPEQADPGPRRPRRRRARSRRPCSRTRRRCTGGSASSASFRSPTPPASTGPVPTAPGSASDRPAR